MRRNTLLAPYPLSIMNLPTVINNRRNGAGDVPRHLREASLALGATRSGPSSRCAPRREIIHSRGIGWAIRPRIGDTMAVLMVAGPSPSGQALCP
jgi:ABC-type phosphate transport system permease subunit